MRRLSGGPAVEFRDFYVSRTYLGGKKLAWVQGLFEGAAREPVADGTYISTTGYFNWSRTDWPAMTSVDHSVEVGRMIGAAYR